MRVKREKLVGHWLLSFGLSKHLLAPCCGSSALCQPHVQTVFMHVDPTDSVAVLKGKLQELLQKVGLPATAGRGQPTALGHGTCWCASHL